MIKIILDYILEFIKALSLLSIPILIFYFRKPLASLARAFSEAESIKWGKRGEFKRYKKEINKMLDQIQPEDKKVEWPCEIVEKQDKIIFNTNKQLLLMTDIALSLSLLVDMPELTNWLKEDRDTMYKEIKSIDPDSKVIVLCDSFISKGLVPPIDESQQSKP